MFLVRRMKGQGAYAKVFQASTVDPMNVTILPPATEEEEEEEDDTHHMILKVQKPACAWEFYICHELRERLKTRDSSSLLLDSFMRVNRGYFFATGSVLASEYHRYGTLLDVINKWVRNSPCRGGLEIAYYIVGNRGLPWFMFFYFFFLVKETSGILFFEYYFLKNNIPEVSLTKKKKQKISLLQLS